MYKILLNDIKVKNTKSANGVVTFDAVIGAAKVHEFASFELPDVPEQFQNEKTIKINFTESVLKNSLESMSFLPVTKNHPTGLIMSMAKSEALAYLGKGLTSEAKLTNGELTTKVSIIDPDLVTDVLNDNNQLSWGGLVNYRWLDADEAKNKGYHAELINEIIGDHVAVVVGGEGRCGDQCTIDIGEVNNFIKDEAKNIFKNAVKAIKNSLEKPQKTDDKKNININSQKSTKGKKVKVLLNGKEFDVDEAIAAEIENAIGALKGELKALQNENKELQKANDELQKIKAKARFEEVLNKAKEIDPDFEIDTSKEVTVLDIINSVMGTDEKNEGAAYSAFNAFHKFHKAKQVESEITNTKFKDSVKSAYETANDIYDEILGE